MIEESIKFHEEPIIVYYGSSTQLNPPFRTKEQDAAWFKQIEEARTRAKSLFEVGDFVKLNTSTQSEIEILGFVEDNQDVITYQNEPCIIIGINRTWQSPNPIKYGLNEVNYTTHRKPIKITATKESTNE